MTKHKTKKGWPKKSPKPKNNSHCLSVKEKFLKNLLPNSGKEQEDFK